MTLVSSGELDLKGGFFSTTHSIEWECEGNLTGDFSLTDAQGIAASYVGALPVDQTDFYGYGPAKSITFKDADSSDIFGAYQVVMSSSPDATYYYGINNASPLLRQISAFSIDSSTGVIAYINAFSAPTDFGISGIKVLSDSRILFACENGSILRVYSLSFDGTNFSFTDYEEITGYPRNYGTDVFSDGNFVYIKPEMGQDTEIKILNISEAGVLSLNANSLDLGLDIYSMNISEGNSMLYFYCYISGERRIYAYSINASTGALTYVSYHIVGGSYNIFYLETDDEDMVFAADNNNALYSLSCTSAGVWLLRDTATIGIVDISYNRTLKFLMVMTTSVIYSLRIKADRGFLLDDSLAIPAWADVARNLTANNANGICFISMITLPAARTVVSYTIL